MKMKQVMESIGTVLYECLKKKHTYPTSKPQVSMVAVEKVYSFKKEDNQ